MFTTTKKVGVSVVVLVVALLIFMRWAMGGTLFATWLDVKVDDGRRAGHAMVSEEDRGRMARKLIESDEPTKREIKKIAQTQNAIRKEKESIDKARETITGLEEMVALMLTDLEQHPNKQAFTYRTMNQSQPQVFSRETVETDLGEKISDLEKRKERQDTALAKLASMERREKIMMENLEKYERARMAGIKEYEDGELLRVIRDELKMEVALLQNESSGIEGLDNISLGIVEVRRQNDDVRMEIAEYKLLLGTKQADSGLDPRPAPKGHDVKARARAVLGKGPLLAEIGVPTSGLNETIMPLNPLTKRTLAPRE